MNKNDIIAVNIDGCSSEGLGVAHFEGRAVFIKGALPSESCQIKIMKVSNSSVYGRLEKLIDVSPHRIEPDCIYYNKCGGCDFRHVSYEEELNIKLQRVNDAFSRIGALDLRAEKIIGSASIERYRNKAIFAVSRDSCGRAVTGFFRSRSHEINAVDSCLLQDKAADAAAKALREWMDEFSVSSYDEGTCKGLIRHLFVREGMVCIVSARKPPHLKELISKMKTSCSDLSSIILNINKTRGNTVLTGSFETIWGSDTVETIICDLRFRLSPLSFCQINKLQAEKLYNLAIDFAKLEGSETVLDLYCGAGAIGLVASKHVKKVIGAEVVEPAIADARFNAELNGITNAEFICADASQAAEKLKSEGLRPDVIFLDPPRKGLSPDVISSCADMSPDRIVYVSCDPATLSRDLKLFNELGYKAVKACAVDMFPRTSHVETVVLITRNM
jgi:23S rRNA (uracil1939-C5)-methyltransferase